MMRRRRYLTAGAVAVVVTALAACGGSSGSSATQSNSGGDGSSKIKSLTLWHLACDTPEILKAYQAYTAATGVTIDLVDVPCNAFETTTKTKWATGDRPDVLEYHGTVTALRQLNAKKNLLDLSDMAFTKNSPGVYPGIGTLDGKVYAAITHFPSVFGIYYNKQVLADAGLKPPKSFVDLASICTVLKPKNIAPIYESGKSQWPTQILPFLYVSEYNANDAYGEALSKRTAKLDDSSGYQLKALEAYQNFKATGCFNKDAATGTNEDALRAVLTGSAAMTALHSDSYPTLLSYANGDAKALDAKVGFVPVSATSPVGSISYGPFGTYAIPKTGKADRENAAKEFLTWLTGAGYQEMVTNGPLVPIINTAKIPEGFSQLQLDFQAAAKNANITYNQNLLGYDNFGQLMSEVLAGQKTARDVASALVIQVTQASKAAGISGW